MGTTQQTDISRAEWLRVMGTREACAHLGISTEGWQNIWESIEWFRAADRNAIACTSTKRSELRMVAAMFTATTRQAAAWLLGIAPTSACDIDELTQLLDNGNEATIATLHRLISLFREGATHAEVSAGVSESLVSRINGFFGFGQAREDAMMDLAMIAAQMGWSAATAKREMGAQWASLGVKAESSINVRIRNAKAVLAELEGLGF